MCSWQFLSDRLVAFPGLFTGVGKASVDILFTVSYLRGGERAGVGDGGDELVSEREEEESVEKEEIKRATL